MSNEATKNYLFIYYLYIILYINTDRRQEQYNEDDPEEFLKTKGTFRRATFSVDGNSCRRSATTRVAGNPARVAQLFTVAHIS